MLQTLKPQVIGHFDLIRLFRPKFSLSQKVWNLIKRNVSEIKSFQGIVELNSRALKKNLPHVYPQEDILDYMISKDILFTLSDDSHAPDQVGLFYDELYKTLIKKNITSVWIPDSGNTRKEIHGIKNYSFWNKFK